MSRNELDSGPPKRVEFGDDDSEEFRRLSVQLRRTLASICSRDLADHIEDLTQEAVIRVMNQQRRSEGAKRFNTSYIRKVAYSVLVDEIRKFRRRREEQPEAWERSEPRLSGSPNPEQVAAGREVGEKIGECLGTLIANRRRAVTLYLQGHRVPEIAGLLGWSRKKAENLVFRGMADLRLCISNKGVRL